MLPLRVDGCHQAKHRIYDQDEQVHRCFEKAVKTQGDAAARDGYIPQVFDHVLLRTKRRTS